MDNLKITIIFLALLLSCSFGFSQSKCETIQCDCENIPDAEKDPGLKDLCLYYEQLMIDLCTKGEVDLECRSNARGPNAWRAIKMKPVVKKPIKVVTNNTNDNDTFEHLIAEIRTSDNTFATYAKLHDRMEKLQKKRPGLSLAMSMSDYFVDVHLANHRIEFALMFANYTKEYNDGSIGIILAKIIEPLKDLGELDIDQMDMKYELAIIFNDLATHGIDVLSLFGEDNYYHNKEVVRFIKECYASNSTKKTKKQMKKLRAASNRIFLRRIDHLIPIANKSKLTNPIRSVNKGVLNWNEQLLDKTLNSLTVISEIIKNKKWDKSKLNKAIANFKHVYDNELWPSNNYTSHFIKISKELPIVWELLRALFLSS